MSESKTRKILYSPGYGAGWTSWHGGSRESRLFMLHYPPLVEFLEAGGDASKLDIDRKGKLHPVILRFMSDWNERFPSEDAPCLGGAGQLRVLEVPSGTKVRIKEHDGYERVQEHDDDEEWF